MDSIFTKIIKGEIPAEKVYEDEYTIAFLSIGPQNKGHTLVIPKEEYADFLSTPDEVHKYVIVAAKKVAQAVKDALKCDGLNISTNNGAAAGQEVFHYHVHIIPRWNDDGLKMWVPSSYEEGEIGEYAQKIREKLQ